MTRADAKHEEPATGAFLHLLACNIRDGRHVQAVPDDLTEDMLEHAQRESRRGEDIGGDADL